MKDHFLCLLQSITNSGGVHYLSTMDHLDALITLDILDLLEEEAEHEDRPPRTQIVPLHRDFLALSEAAFLSHFRFTKAGFESLLGLIGAQLEHKDGRGGALSPAVQLQTALNHMAVDMFQRSAGLCFDGSQSAARTCLIKVCDALLSLKGQWIYMPSVAEQARTTQFCLDKFKLPGISMAVDGVHCFFADTPRGVPAHINELKVFWGRKARYSINCQVVGNEQRICDIDVQWPGATHDARIWKLSHAKQIIEEQIVYKIAGDSGYPISQVLVKPYSKAEVNENPRRRAFNRNLSGLRTVMTENIFGRWKKHFPILRNLRCHLELSQKIIVTTAILENIAHAWNVDQPQDDDLPNLPQPHEGHVIIFDDSREATCARGQVERDILFGRMR